MRKGDAKRQEMLAVAERLFCLKGYEATSIQDILDVLHVSKGGFYHHFASKDALLETLFYQRAERALQQTEDTLAPMTDVVARLNTAMYGFMPMRKEESAFAAMILPIMEKAEGRAMRMVYQEALISTFLPLFQREIALAQDDGIVFPPSDDMAEIVLQLLGQSWCEMSMLLIAAAKKAQKADPAALASVLDKYRRGIERLLDAPYGSIEILRLEEWDDIAEELSRRMMLPMQG